MRKNQTKLYKLIRKKGRLLNDEEVVQFYAENIQKKYCAVSFPYENYRGEILRSKNEYLYSELNTMAQGFYLRALGRIVKEGIIETKI